MAEPKRKAGNPNFQKGMKAQEGVGRTKGSVNKYTALARELMSNKSPEIVEEVLEKAMEGDVHCLKMCVDRLLTVHKAVDTTRTKAAAQVIIKASSLDNIQPQLVGTTEDELS